NNHSYMISVKFKKLSEIIVSKKAKKTLSETEISKETKEIFIKNHANQTNIE
ncbi:23332_t:CDS:1, partial [Cetraspora pellucida]